MASVQFTRALYWELWGLNLDGTVEFSSHGLVVPWEPAVVRGKEKPFGGASRARKPTTECCYLRRSVCCARRILVLGMAAVG